MYKSKIAQALERFGEEYKEFLTGFGHNGKEIRAYIETEEERKSLPETYEGYPVIAQVTGKFQPEVL